MISRYYKWKGMFFLLTCPSAFHFRSIGNYKLNKQALPRKVSDLQYILLPFFLFKDVTTDFTHICRERRLNLQPNILSVWHTYKLPFELLLQLLFLEPVTVCISVFKLWSAKSLYSKKSIQVPYCYIPGWSLLLFFQAAHKYVMLFEAML